MNSDNDIIYLFKKIKMKSGVIYHKRIEKLTVVKKKKKRSSKFYNVSLKMLIILYNVNLRNISAQEFI